MRITRLFACPGALVLLSACATHGTGRTTTPAFVPPVPVAAMAAPLATPATLGLDPTSAARRIDLRMPSAIDRERHDGTTAYVDATLAGEHPGEVGVGKSRRADPSDAFGALAVDASAFPWPAANALQEAATKYGPSAGESVLDLNGLVVVSNNPDANTTNTTLNVGAGLGVFLTNVIEVGLRGSGSFTIPNQGDSTITLFGSVDLNFNARLSRRFWLYIGPHFGFTYIEIPGSSTGGGQAGPGSSATEPSGGGQLGARLWLTPSVSLTAEGRVTYSEFEFAGVSSERIDTLVRVGFTYVF